MRFLLLEHGPEFCYFVSVYLVAGMFVDDLSSVGVAIHYTFLALIGLPWGRHFGAISFVG